MTAMVVVLMNLQRVVQFVLIGKNKAYAITSGIDFTYNELVEYYTFIDGTPFGVKVEE